MTAHTDLSPAEDRRWRFDRSISLALVIALCGNIAVGIWFAARLDSRVEGVEAWTKANAGTERRLSVVETKLQMLIDMRITERGQNAAR